MNAIVRPIEISAPLFTEEDQNHAHDAWGANCGPGAIAAICGLTLDAVRPHLKGFDEKRYTNPTMMLGALASLKINHTLSLNSEWPVYGLVRIQWEGPWMATRVPVRARYRHTHWVGAQYASGQSWIFDINCMNVGGWVPETTWANRVVPWLLAECEPKADGRWHRTHVLAIRRPA